MPAAFLRRIDQEIVQRSEQQRTEPAAIRIRRLKKIFVQDHYEEILGQVLGVVRGIAAAINEGENRVPINLAQLGQAGIDLATGTGRATLSNQAPASRNKVSESPRAFSTRRSSHAPSVNGLLF